MMDGGRSGNLVPNVTIDDMGPKTVGNDLDNAWIHFDNVKLPKSAMLNRFAEIDSDGWLSCSLPVYAALICLFPQFRGLVSVSPDPVGQYHLRVPGVRPFEMIAQV